MNVTVTIRGQAGPMRQPTTITVQVEGLRETDTAQIRRAIVEAATAFTAVLPPDPVPSPSPLGLTAAVADVGA